MPKTHQKSDFELTIRPFQTSDAIRLGEVYRTAIMGATAHYSLVQRQAWAGVNQWDADRWLARITGIQPWVAQRDGLICGYADVQPSGLVDHLFVADEAKGQGVADELMRQVFAHAARLGLTAMHTDASRNSQGFFARHGFMPTAFKAIEARGVMMDHTRMELSDVARRPKLAAQRAARPGSTAPDWRLAPCAGDDFESVLALRIAAMRPSLERLGRFDEARARARLASSFEPAHGRHVVRGDRRVGFVTLKPATGNEAMTLEHLYIDPSAQGCGVGGAVLQHVIKTADDQQRGIRVGVLDQSPALRFYLQAGFVCVGQSAFDWELVRPTAPSPLPSPRG